MPQGSMQAPQTDPRWGKPPQSRSVEERLACGIVLIDKPCGPTSHEVSSYVKKIIGGAKAGHPGTLDPQVSGVLPVGINRGTKIIGHMAHEKKEYVGIMRTDKAVEISTIREMFVKFTGIITQTPPKMSAVRKRPRQRKVYYLELREFKGRDFLFQVGCQAGTYIRTLCSDIGKHVGGANMVELRRTEFGSISERECVTLQKLSDAYWRYRSLGDETGIMGIVRLPEEVITSKSVAIKDSAVDAVCCGAPLGLPGVAQADIGIEEGQEVAIKTLKGELVGFGIAAMAGSRMAQGGKGIAINTDAVVMERGVYPKYEGKIRKASAGKGG